MDPVHGGGPWTTGPCFVLSPSKPLGYRGMADKFIFTCNFNKKIENLFEMVGFSIPYCWQTGIPLHEIKNSTLI